MTKFAHAKLIEALELHQNILFAEKQAIAVRDLNMVEDILRQKEQSLELVLHAKSEVGENFSENLNHRISIVLELQKLNTKNFRKLHIQDEQIPKKEDKSHPLFTRLRQAYSKN